MSERDRSFDSKFGKGSNIGMSSLKSKDLAQSYIKSFVPSLRGGQKQEDIKFLHIRVQDSLNAQKNLQTKLKHLFDEAFGSFYDYSTFKDKQKILKEYITEQDLYYIFLKEQIASWGQKFARQQMSESGNKKSIFIVQFLRNHKYSQKIQQRNNLAKKNRRDPNQKFVFYINSDGDYIEQIKSPLMIDMNNKFKNKLIRNGDQRKNWALTNKYKQKKTKKQRIYIYIQNVLMQKLAPLYKRFKNKNNFKWTKLISFSDFQGLMKDVKKRQQQLQAEHNLQSSISIHPASKIFDRTQSAIKSTSVINGMSMLSGIKSVKNIIHDKTEHNLRVNDKNFIIHTQDSPQEQKLYHYVMQQKDNNWQRVIYQDKNHAFINQLLKQIQKNEKENQDDQYLRMIKAETLYIITYSSDYDTAIINNNHPNYFNNRYLLDYKNPAQLQTLLNNYARDDNNFIIVIIETQNNYQDKAVKEFIERNKNIFELQNLLIKYKNHAINQNLSMNSKMTNVQQQQSVRDFIEAAIEDRDRDCNPFQRYADSYVYILYRVDNQYLFDEELRRKVAGSARLKKSVYEDENYLQNFLKQLQRGKDYGIILTDDNGLRKAQQVAKKFNRAQIVNVTQRKNVKDEIKVLAWGPLSDIKNVIFSIVDKQGNEKRRDYMFLQKQIFMQNPLPRRMPKKIQFKQGNNVTIKLSSQETNKDSQTMENNLKYYFKQQVRLEYYRNPDEIRLVNKVQEPLTFIICRDDPKQLQYLREIARQERDDLRQQYIIYSKDPVRLFNTYFNNDQRFERFRFISNSWKAIQAYIIGVYQNAKGNNNQPNDHIYQDQLVHLFYVPQDTHIIQLIQGYQLNQSSRVWNNIRTYPIGELEWVALEQSPHHVYYVLVDETAGNFNSTSALNLIQKTQQSLQVRGIAPKRIKMLLINQKPGAMRDKYIQGTFSDGAQTLRYVSDTGLISPRYQINKPHIIVDRNSYRWDYFLNKHQSKDRYIWHPVDSIQQSMKTIENVRNTQVGSQFWFLTSNQKDLIKFLQYSRNIEQGMRIYGIFHGPYPTGIPQNKIIFSNPDRQQIQNFLLNVHKRSQTVFSPSSLIKNPPILAMSKVAKIRIPVDQREITKWKQDLQAEEVIFNNIGDLRGINKERNIFWICDAEEDKIFRNMKQVWPNLWRIVFDTNQKQRRKAHVLINMYPDIREVYYGHYPAQIKHYLRYLRYNIKNPPSKLRKIYNKQFMNIFLQKQLQINARQLENLYKINDSTVKFFNFGLNQQQIQNAINYALSNPNYDNLFIFSRAAEGILSQIPARNRINYLIFDQNFRTNGYKNGETRLLTDQYSQYISYLNNLPENRYMPASLYKGAGPHKLLYLNNGTLDKQIQQLKKINRRNPNFTIQHYINIADLRALKDNFVVLTDANFYNQHIQQLGHLKNIQYFILGNDKQRNLYPNGSKSQFFITKQPWQLYGYYNNLVLNKPDPTPDPAHPFPTIYRPSILQIVKQQNRSSHFLNLQRSNIYSQNYTFYPPFKKEQPPPPPPPPVSPEFNPINFVDKPSPHFFNVHSKLTADNLLKPQIVQNYFHLLPKNRPIRLNLDAPVMIDDSLQRARPDDIGFVPVLSVPRPKPTQTKLAIVHPDNTQFRDIFRVLQINLSPKSFSKVQSFPYGSQFDFRNLYKNQNKFMGYDRTIIFLNPATVKYEAQLIQIVRKMNGKAKYYYFSDNFHNLYDDFKRFLSPYTINNHQIPYINKNDPKYWLSTKLFNVMVPLNKKKRYDSIKRDNIFVLPYTCQQDIQNQLHRRQQFVIIVCEKKDYHNLKKFTRMSPRCIVVIDDSEQLKQDEIPLFRYPRKVLYYGNDTINYLKTRIPTRPVPLQQQMKTLFFNKNNPQQIDYAYSDEFGDYEKVPYSNAEDLFIKLIQNFKNSANFKVPANLSSRDLIKLHPKIYIQRQTSYMINYMDQYSKLEDVHNRQYKQSFKNIIKPQQYKHLKRVEYENVKDIKHMLDKENCPCLVYLDQNIRQNLKIEDQFKNRHLFIMMFDLLDMWIDRNGYLIQPQKLSRQQLAVKQTLFTSMFNKDVFETYNDMGYFYLSNTAHMQKQRKIYFMTREALVAKFKEQPNLLMVVFVQYNDLRFIPVQFYDMKLGLEIQDRVKLIFIHSKFIHNENILYIKYTQIDPVIKHINRVEMSSRQDYCIYPSHPGGQIKWHKFMQKHKGFKPIEYQAVGEQMNSIAENIKGKYRQIYVICQKQQQQFIRDVFNQYAIKSKKNSNQKLSFWHLTDADNKSYMVPFSNIKPSNINFLDDNEQKFDIAGQPIDIKANNSFNKNFGNTTRDSKIMGHSPNSLSPNSVQPHFQNHNPTKQVHKSSSSREIRVGNMDRSQDRNVKIEDIVQSKDFVLNINQKLKNTIPVGNLYANRIQYFKNLDVNALKNQPLNQLLITNQNLNTIKSELQNNPNVFLVYVSDSLPPGKQGNSIIIKQTDIPNFIGELQNIQNGKNNMRVLNNANIATNYTMALSMPSPQPVVMPMANHLPNYSIQDLDRVGNSPVALALNNIQNSFSKPLSAGNAGNKPNLKDFKVVKLFYDSGVDLQVKKQILFAALKNKNFQPFMYKDFDTLKKLIKQENSISLLLISKQPPNLKQQLEKQNFTVIKNKKGRIIMPKHLNPTIQGLSTILQQNQSQFQHLGNEQFPNEVDAFLKMMQNNPQKGRNILLQKKYDSDKNEASNKQEPQLRVGNNMNSQNNIGFGVQDLNPQDSDKLNLHSKINMDGNDAITNKEWIRQRLDGGVIVVFADKNFAENVYDIRKRINILVQQYSHSNNLHNNIRDKKDKFTIVLVENKMIPQIKTIKEQYPKTVFVYVNPDRKQISAKDKQTISYQINSIEQFEPIITQIYQQNQKIKLNDQMKLQSKVDNKKTSYVDNGNSWRLSTGYQNTKTKNAFVFLKQQRNKYLLKRLQNLSHITLVPYKDFNDAHKKFNTYNGYQVIVIANEDQIPTFEQYVSKKKEQAYMIKLNPPQNYRENPKIKKNILLSTENEDEIANFLITKFGETIVDKNQERPKQGKSYAPRYQPNMFGTTPRFSSQKDYVPYKNDPIYSSRGMKSLSRQSKVLKADSNGNRQVSPKNAPSPYYNR